MLQEFLKECQECSSNLSSIYNLYMKYWHWDFKTSITNFFAKYKKKDYFGGSTTLNISTSFSTTIMYLVST